MNEFKLNVFIDLCPVLVGVQGYQYAFQIIFKTILWKKTYFQFAINVSKMANK